MKRVIDYAHRKEMKVTVILSTNVITKLPENEPPHGQLDLNWTNFLICPRQKDDFDKSIAVGEYYISEYRNADAFSVCAGDWGGCSCGTCSWQTYLAYVNNYYNIVKRVNQNARFYMLTWSIGYWSKPNPALPFWRDHFDKEIEFTENIINTLPNLPKDIGIIVPCHHLYRPLAMQQYTDKPVPVWPTKSVVKKVQKSGHEFLAWPHFIMEDDVHRDYTFGRIVSRVGYIRKLVNQLAELQIDGIIGNFYFPEMQLLSAFAFSRLTQDPNLQEEEIIEHFVKFLGNGLNKKSIYNILLLLENTDPWEDELPQSVQIKHPNSLFTWEQAVDAMKQIKLNSLATNHLFLNYCNNFLKALDYTIQERYKNFAKKGG